MTSRQALFSSSHFVSITYPYPWYLHILINRRFDVVLWSVVELHWHLLGKLVMAGRSKKASGKEFLTQKHCYHSLIIASMIEMLQLSLLVHFIVLIIHPHMISLLNNFIWSKFKCQQKQTKQLRWGGFFWVFLAFTVLYGEKKNTHLNCECHHMIWREWVLSHSNGSQKVLQSSLQRSIALFLVLPLTQNMNLDQPFHLCSVYSSVNLLS